MRTTLKLLIALAAALLAGAELRHEQFRPRYHFTPPKNWTNDPNGLVFFKGEYHIFYQHNPFGDKWGHMSWGHAVSADLVNWQDLPVALAEEDGVMIFSGSVVVDPNTSGLCDRESECLVAIYTGHTPTKQAQHIAVSNDHGRTWKKFAGNPVLDLNKKDFRDPKVFWYAPGEYWVMIAVLPDEHKAQLYKSSNLKKWELMSDFGPAGAVGGVWECPDLFVLPVDNVGGQSKWVMSININPGGPQGGSGNQYFVGEFDGRKFVNDNTPDVTLWADYGSDFYASTSFSGIPDADGRRLWIGWESNWLYANDEPTSPWRGVQSFPRSLRLRNTKDGFRLVQEPVAELKKIRQSPITMKKVPIDEANKRLAQFKGQSYEIEVEGATEVHVLKDMSKNSKAQTIVSLKDKVTIDRGNSGDVSFNKSFSKVHESVPARSNKVRVYVDHSVVEVFANDGLTVLSDRVFPTETSNGIELVGERDAVVTFTLWKMGSAAR